MTIPFGRWRLVVSMNRSTPPPATATSTAAQTVATRFPESFGAADYPLAKLNRRAAAVADLRQWQALAVIHGFRFRR